MVLGTATFADGGDGTPTIVLWITPQGGVCSGSLSGDAAGSNCGNSPSVYGVVSAISGETNSISYLIPADTAAVQIVTSNATYWQRPVVGYGVIPFGQTIKKPQQLIALAVDGTELARWDVGEF